MDAFESLVGSLLRKEGFWTNGSYIVELTKEEKSMEKGARVDIFWWQKNSLSLAPLIPDI